MENATGDTFKAITKDSKTKTDFKKVGVDMTYKKFATKKKHHEFYCEYHMKSRLINLTYRDILVDVVLSGTNFIFQRIDSEQVNQECKERTCDKLAEYKVVRF